MTTSMLTLGSLFVSALFLTAFLAGMYRFQQYTRRECDARPCREWS
jgi:hypothetical protein